MLNRIRVLGQRIRGLLWRRRLDEEFQQELDTHLEMLIEENLRRGLSPEEARRAARVQLGGITQLREIHREMWSLPWLESFLQDLRYGLRQLRRNPGFTAVAVLTLALGIGANTTIFSVISSILLRKPPVQDPDRLCAIASKNYVHGFDLGNVSAPDFESWRNQNHVFAEMAAETVGSFTLTGNGAPESVQGDLVTPGFFQVLGVAPSLGRAFLSSEGEAGKNHVLILSYRLWQGRFGSDPNVVGKNTMINGAPYTIVGVMPPLSEAFPLLWTPLVFEAKDLSPSARGNHYLSLVLGRLKPGVTVQNAQAEMSSIAHRLAEAYPKTNKDWGATVVTLQEYMIRKPNVRNALMMLVVTVGLVLLIACANVAGLLLARGATRSHEMAVRSAVGASRLRLTRQMLAECLLIGTAGGGAGLLVSVWGIHLLRVAFNFDAYGRQQAAGFRLDQPTLLFTLAVSLLTIFIFGVVPAIRASKADPRDALSSGDRAGSSGVNRSRLRNALVMGEIALSLVLLVGAGTIMRDVVRELTEPNGINPNHLLVADIDLKGPHYRQPANQREFFKAVTEKLRDIPGVESADAMMGLPLRGSWSTTFNIVGQPPLPETKRPSADYFAVGPDYFRTMQIPLFKGREFSASDNARSPVVAIVNREFVRRFFPKGRAIGQQIEVDTGHHKKALIVGFVGNVNDYPGQIAPRPQIYESYLQFPFPSMTLALRSPVAPSSLAPLLRGAVWSVDKDQPIGRIRTMNDVAEENGLGGDKMFTELMGVFAGLALALAAVGIYGVVSYSVNQRTREIGIRMALGAEKKDVFRLVFGQGSLLTGIGCTIGFALALPLPRVFLSLFNGLAPQGPLVLVAVAVVVAVVSLFATYIPARRAAKVDPMVALRYE